jgi:DNA repair exonuclease SbcCD ATPase subunit
VSVAGAEKDEHLDEIRQLKDQLNLAKEQLRFYGSQEKEVASLRNQLYDLEQKNLQMPQMQLEIQRLRNVHEKFIKKEKELREENSRLLAKSRAKMPEIRIVTKN